MSKTFNQLKNDAGFTLTELIITLAILGIIAAMAAPNMQQQLNQAKIKNTANLVSTAFKNAKVQSVIEQKSIKVVLTNTSIDKSIKLFRVGEDTSRDVPMESYDLGKDFTIVSLPGTLNAVSFTPNKSAYQGETGNGTLMGQDANGNPISTGFSICLGTGTTQYTVRIDANSNISTQETGSCS